LFFIVNIKYVTHVSLSRGKKKYTVQEVATALPVMQSARDLPPHKTKEQHDERITADVHSGGVMHPIGRIFGKTCGR